MIRYICPDSQEPAGGIRAIYRHVDYLTASGIDAAVFHQRQGFHCDWFSNRTRIVHDLPDGREHVWIFPEIYGQHMFGDKYEARRIIFNQNVYYTFRGWDLKAITSHPYQDERLLGVLTTSLHGQQVLNNLFDKPVLNVPPTWNNRHLRLGRTKMQMISYFDRKASDDLHVILSALAVRDRLPSWRLVNLAGKSDQEIATLLRDSAIYLHVTKHEGFGSPIQEALYSGCVVSGYFDQGSAELAEGNDNPSCAIGDIFGTVAQVEECAHAWDQLSDQQRLLDAERRHEWIAQKYSPEIEQAALLSALDTLGAID